MKKIAFFIGVFLSLISNLFSALPPFYESKKELKSILDSQELESLFGSAEPLLKIERNQNGYEIATNKHTLQVDVHYEPQTLPGPAHYVLKFHELKSVK